MSAGPPDEAGVCGGPTYYTVEPAEGGGYMLRILHTCAVVPPCLTVVRWGPFEDLETAAQIQRIAWPAAIPPEEGGTPASPD